jgi:hypothetical protein
MGGGEGIDLICKPDFNMIRCDRTGQSALIFISDASNKMLKGINFVVWDSKLRGLLESRPQAPTTQPK